MKRTYQYIGLALVTALGLSSCSDKFLEDKKNYGAVGEDIYNYEAGAQGRINDLYGWCLPTTQSDLTWKNPSVGKSDIAGQSTEEYGGFTSFTDPEVTMSSTTAGTAVVDYFGGDDLENVQSNTFGTIRNINNAIQGITNSTLSQELKDKLLGQAYFFRAWTYYKLVKWYGGVPIIKDVLPATPAAFTQRSSAKECFEFIIDDLNTSARMLEGKTMDYGRITAGTALALKGRVLTLWCSPMFNRKGDQTRYQEAYTIMKEDLAKIDACGYGLYGEGDPGTNASTFANMFVTKDRNPEAVFVTLYNKLVDFSGNGDAVRNNRWERDIRPDNAGGGGLKPSKAIVDLFPMSDGKLPATASTYTRLEKSDKDYDERYPFMDRDPRFYRTFAFPDSVGLTQQATRVMLRLWIPVTRLTTMVKITCCGTMFGSMVATLLTQRTTPIVVLTICRSRVACSFARSLTTTTSILLRSTTTVPMVRVLIMAVMLYRSSLLLHTWNFAMPRCC